MTWTPKSGNCCNLTPKAENIDRYAPVQRILWVALLLTAIMPAVWAQDYQLRKEGDSLYYLNEWRLPYPVYQFQTGDVNGDGSIDAMVGVIKKTRFHREEGRRLFIFKQVHGKVRPLWLGSQLGGILQDFRFTDGRIRSLETTTDSLYVVAEYKWGGFGMAFDRFLIKGTNHETAIKIFSQ